MLSTLGLWGLFLLVPTPISHANAEDIAPQCPKYRTFDFENPTSPQYLAPDGCRCMEGMSDLHCHYCTSDAPCKAVNPDHVCRQGPVFAAGDEYRSYKCKLAGTVEALFKGGKAAVFANITNGTAHMSIYNTDSVNQLHAIDCFLEGCDFQPGATGGICDSVVCKCTEACADFTRSVVEGMISGNPAELIVEGGDGFSTSVSVSIEGAPFAIEALCNASSCTTDPDAEEDVALRPESRDTEWKDAATFSLIVLCVMAAAFAFLVCFACLPLLAAKCRQNFSNNEAYDQQFTPREEECAVLNSGTLKHVLEFLHINRTVQLRAEAAKAYGKKEKQILNNISGSVESGTLMAIMGPSGAGKSSLLNILAAVGNGQSRVSGQILLDGKLQTTGYRNKVAYVQQDDSLYDTLTVQECIEYSAMLRLPRAMKREEKRTYATKTLQELRLTDIATNRIGSGGRNAGVSGGERKRVSIGMELVSQAPVLVLDEPTSGLDSFAANQVVNVLSELSARNRIVILSIHQPSMKSFMTFDQILLLGCGRVMYNGKPSDVEQYMADNGFTRPSLDTVADHMLDVVSDRSNCDVLKGPDAKRSDYEKIMGLTPNPVPSAEDGEAFGSEAKETENKIERKPLLNEVMVLFQRALKDTLRNRELFVMQLGISIALAVFGGAIFNDVSNNLAGFQNRMGAFYFSLSFFAFASFSSMDIFVRERHIFVRETGSKYFRPFSYFVSKVLLDMIALRVIPASIFSVIFYWMMGLRNSPEAFVVFWATIVLFNVCAGIMSICISIATPTVGQANLIAAVWFLIMLLFGGFLVNVDTMQWWYAWVKYTSIFYYSFEILMTNELAGLLLSFDAPGYPALPIYGEVFLLTVGMDTSNQTRDLICLCCLAVGFGAVAFLLLLIRVPPSAGRQFQRMESENKRMCEELKAANSNTSDDEPQENNQLRVSLNAKSLPKVRLGDWNSSFG